MRPRWLAISGLAAAVLAAGVGASAADWSSYKVRRTFVADQGVRNPFGRSDVLAVDFLTAGLGKPDGSDIAVFAGDGRRAAEFKLMMLGPGDRARLAIRMLRGVDTYHVCYAGPARKPVRKWEPQVGLVLETRKLNGGNVRKLHQMMKLVGAADPVYGRWLVPNIFHGYNPFGPSDRYVSIYRGWLHVPKDGAYRFATTSDDASYFLLDGKLMSSKPRWGRGPANARFAGKPVDLKAGAHRLEYYHVEGTGTQFCVGAWQPPGGRFGVIPAGAFPGVFTAKQTGLRLAGVPVPIDLTYRAGGGVIYESHRLYKVGFSDATPGAKSKGWTPRWSFGDGITSAERNPQHVYFLPGEYTVTFELTRGTRSVSVKQKIVVAAELEPLRQSNNDTATRYFKLARGYDFKTMESAHLVRAIEFFATMGQDEEIIQSAAALFPRDDPAAQKMLYRCAVLLGERLRDLKKKPDEALRVFAAAEQRVAEPAQKARLIRRVGDTYLYALGKPDAAMAEYRKVLERHGSLEDNVPRLAQIRIGDAHKAQADHDRAVAAYRKAEGMRRFDRSHAVTSVRRGALAQSIEDYMARKRYDEAKTLLDVWGWEHPTDRIAGQWSFVAAQLDLARGEADAALREALQCANANKTGRLADRLLLTAGRIMLSRREGAEAVALARRIQTEYPESAEQQAAALLECEGLLAAKQHHEAAKRAAAAYAQANAHPGAEGTEQFLMVAADASLAADDKDKAVELLRLIVREHPRTDTAGAAKTKLRALGIRSP